MTSTILFEGERAEQLDALTDRPRRLNGSMLLWVDLHDPSPHDVDEVAEEFGLDDESVRATPRSERRRLLQGLR